MEQSHSSSRLTRRGFLRLAGLATGAVVVPDWPGGHSLKVGVLLPTAVLYPAMGQNLVTGMRLYFGAAGHPVTFAIHEIGAGTASARRTSRALLEQGGVDVVVAVTGEHVAATLRPLYADHGVPLVVCNAGANVVRPDDQGTFLVFNSLKLWQSNWALGFWAGHHLGSRAVSALSFYDSGYDAPYLFRLGFEAAGGDLLETFVSHTPAGDGNLTPLLAAIRDAGPDFVYASYCGAQAVEFVQAYARSGLAGHIPLIGSAFLVDDRSVLPQLGSAALGIKTSLPWAAPVSGSEDQAVLAAYPQQTGRSADSFAALGYDTAHLITRMMAEGVHEAPRETGGPLFLREVRRHGLALANVVTAHLSSIAERDIQRAVAESSPKSGWLAPYLCL